MKQSLKYLLTAVIILIAVVLVLFKYWDYVANPWTRDGQVRAEVIQVAPRVSGPIVKIAVKDNQRVKAGDLLFVIDPRTFEAALEQARAQLDMTGDKYLATNKQVEAAAAQVEVSRAALLETESGIKELDALIEQSRSEYERQQKMLLQNATSPKAVEVAKALYDVKVEKRKGAVAARARAQSALAQSQAELERAKAALGALGDANPEIRKARAAVREAQLNLEFTRVVVPADGYVTNLNLRVGSHAVANQPMLALVDEKSFWVYGYFRETSVRRIRPGDKAVVTLMSYPDSPVEGIVDSLGWGISQQDGSTGFELLPRISPTFDWIRLAQRVPVRIHLDRLPEGVVLRVGTTASVLVRTGTAKKK